MEPIRIFTPEEPAGTRPTVAQILSAFLRDQKSELKATTYADRARTGERFAKDFGERSWESLRPSEVKAWIQHNPAWKSATTRWGVLLSLKRIFNWAVRDRMITSNPLIGLSIKKGPKRDKTTEAEFQTMLRCTDGPFRRVLVFMRACGCRPQDARNLEWSFIQWKHGCAVIPADRHKTGSRSGQPKILPISQAGMRLLTHLQKESGIGHVFRNSRGQPWTPVAFAQRLRDIRIKAREKGWPLRAEATLHGIRHLCGTVGLERGGNLKLVSQVLGHARVATTEEFYLHLSEGEMRGLREAVELMSKRDFSGDH